MGAIPTEEEPNADGWFRTGDVAEMDQEGNLFFKGRKKDVIVTSAGLNIYPDDLEAALNAQSEVRDSAVLGIDTPQGPEPFAVLLLRDDRADADAIVKRANQTLSSFQQVRRWSNWPEEDFPRTPTLKTRKPLVMERLKAEELRSRGVAGSEISPRSSAPPLLSFFRARANCAGERRSADASRPVRESGDGS